MTDTLAATTTNDEGLTGLCRKARPALAALGDLGTPLLGVLDAVEATARRGGVELLDDPGFALDVLAAASQGTDPALVGRVLDFLRSQTDAVGAAPAMRAVPGGRRRAVTVADAVASYEAGALALMATATQVGYRTWAHRLVAAHGQDDPDSVTAGDVKDLVAKWVIKARSNPHARRDGNSIEAAGVGAFRHLWAYFVDKGWTTTNVAKTLRKPAPDDPLRRPFRPEEAAVIRHLARGLGRTDGLLNEVTITLSERLGLRRIELSRLRICDADLARAEMWVWGKGNKYRTMPIPPTLLALLERYIESRRPAHIPVEEWLRSEEKLLRHRPDGGYAAGKAVGPSRLDRMFRSLRDAAPEIFANGDLSQHCYRHALGTFVDGRYTRAVTKAVLGHKGRKSSTDHYVYVADETIREAICAYERHLLAADPTVHQDDQTSATATAVETGEVAQ